MKTKHLLTALALPALFAACTADDIVNESANQAQRAALNENFKLNLGGVESRLSAGEPGAAFKFEYEEGDMVGSAIIDLYNPSGATFDAKYATQYFVSTNQPFTFDGSKWNCNHTMVEGKYLFYYPYNEKNNSRGAVQFSIPVMQDLSDKTTGEFNPKAAIEKYGISVGYKFLNKEDLSASVQLAPIFSYARLVLKLDNQFAGGEVEKIVLQAPSAQAFKLNGQLDNKEIEKIFRYEESGKDLTTGKDFTWNVYDETANYALTSAAAPYYVADLNNTSSVMVGKVPAGTKLTVDAQNNHVFETYMVMPAQEFTSALTVFLYMADGRVYEGETAASLDFNRNTPKKVEVALTAATSKVYIVASEEDWNENVAKMGKESAEFIIADPNFTITNDMKFPTEENAIITVANVTVSGDNVTLKNIDATTITVAKGAKLTTDVTAEADKIINKGELVVAANPEARAIVAYDIDAIENHATLTVKEDAVISTALTNKKGAKVVNAGTLTISGTNNGTIDNEGTIYASTAKFLNDEVEFKMVGTKKEIINTPTINNKATGKFRADGEFTNKAMFVNEGILSCKNNAGTIINSLTDDTTRENANTFEAAGVIDAKTGSTTYITTNNAKVIVYAMKQANVTVNTNNKTIEYVATNAAETVDGSAVTDIIATKDLEIKWVDATKNYAFKNLTVKGNASVKLTAPANKTLPISTMNVEANATIATNFTISTLNVKEGAVINIPAEKTLTVTTIDNEGTISVVGTLVAQSYNGTEDALGDIEDNGKGTIDWAATELEVLEDAYVEAYAKAIKAWTEISTSDSDSPAMVGYNLKDEDAFAHFQNCYNVFSAGTYKQDVYEDLADALKAYNEEYTKDDSNTAKTVEFKYTDAVDAFMTTMKADEDYSEAMEDFKVATGTDNYFFVATTDGDETVTAEANALAAFKNLVKSASLSSTYKCVLNTETAYNEVKSYVPAYTFAFESDNIYKIFDELIFAGYTFTGDLDATVDTTEKLKSWVANASAQTDTASTANKIAKDYVNATVGTTTYAVYKESLKWNYNDATIAAIRAEVKGE